MSTATTENKPILPPDEKFWERYSPHHELPLASMTSFFIHGLVIGVMVLGAFWYLFERESDSHKPPSMDVVQLVGGGDGSEGASGEAGLPGDASPREFTPDTLSNPPEAFSEPDMKLKDAPSIQFQIPQVSVNDSKTDLESVLADVEKEAADRLKRDSVPQKTMKIAKSSGTGNPKGVGGYGGLGGGIGRGKQGPGSGVGGIPGSNLSKSQIYALRWNFDLGRNTKEHIDQLKAIGFVVVLVSAGGETFSIKDLNRIPVEVVHCDISKYKEAAQWENRKVESLMGLARELKLGFVPTVVKMFMPEERETQIADEEIRFTKLHNNKIGNVRQSYFVFRLRDGVYVPETVRQVNQDGRLFQKSK